MSQSIVIDYKSACVLVSIDDLHSKREQLTMKYFNCSVIDTELCLNYTFPEKRNLDIGNKLRKSSQCQISQSETVTFSKSLIPYCYVTNNDSQDLFVVPYYCECYTPTCYAIRQFC
jgi:hypothetical protein